MIRLFVEDYCDNCPEFEADVEKCPLCNLNGDLIHHNTDITCSILL